MDLRNFLDSTYLKLASAANLTEEANAEAVKNVVAEAIAENFVAVMIRPNMVKMAKQMILEAGSTVAVGTVIGFPEGTMSIEEKLQEAEQAIEDGADELDFVVNYEAFVAGDTDLIRSEISKGTAIALLHMKKVKWIIETAALDIHQITQLCSLIKNVVLTSFPEDNYSSVFVKSSTGYYKPQTGRSVGATIPAIVTMLENAAPLPVKASGGIKTYEEAVEYINLGVKRIGTSAAKIIADGGVSAGSY